MKKEIRICLLGDFSGTPDEGMKNISSTVKNKIANIHDVVAITSRSILQKKNYMAVKEFSPDIVHYLHGPTIRSLVILKGLQWYLGKRTKVVVSATRPYFSRFSRWLVPLFKPSIILTQSTRWERFFTEMGCNVAFLPNGVDCNKFSEASIEKKIALRKELGLPVNAKIILHVGHLKENRKLDIFKKIQAEGNYQVVVVGGTSEKLDVELKSDLEVSGVIVLHQYFDDISHIYNAADLYVFPIPDTGNELPDSYNQIGAIDLPLSILEAMACNLPIITTRFGALPRLFDTGDGFHYVDDDEDLLKKIREVSLERGAKTREMILPYDWGELVSRLDTLYKSILLNEEV